MADTIDGKALIQSKQFWLMVLTIIAAIAASPEVLNLIPSYVSLAAALVAVISILIRYVTDMPVTGVITPK